MTDRTHTIQVRCSPKELERFKLAAKRRSPHDKPNLSALFRSVAHEYADKVGIDATQAQGSQHENH